MECMSCGYILAAGSVVKISPGDGQSRTDYRCQHCRAEMSIELRLTKPSPLPPAELKRRTNGVGSHA